MAATSKPTRKKRSSFLKNNWLEFAVIGALVILFLNLLSWPVTIANESLDGSWQLVLTYALKHGLHFGEDVVFTYGPLGSYSSFSYSGYNHAGKYGFELLMRLSMVVFLFRFLLHLEVYSKLGFLFLYLLVLQFLPDAYETFFFFGLISWVAALILEKPMRKREPWVLIGMGSIFLVGISLVKFTLLLAAVFCLGLLLLHFLLQKRWVAAFALAVGYPVCFISSWWLLGQRLADIPGFFIGSLQVARGYAMSMHIATEPRAFWFFILFAIASLASIAVILIEPWKKKRKKKNAWWKDSRWPFLLGHAGLLFMVWKQGVVRSDAHIWQFYCYVPLAAWFLYPILKQRASQLLYGCLLVVQILLMAFAMESFYPGFLGDAPNRFWTNTRSGLSGLLKPNEMFETFRNQLDGEQQALFNRYPILSQIGERSVDVLGNSQGMVINAGLNYRPRPIFQNYVANNAWLQDLNAEYWEDGDTPQVVVHSLDAIDGVGPTHADSQSLLHLLSHYRREAEQGGLVLLSRRKSGLRVVRGENKEDLLKEGVPLPLDRHQSRLLLGSLDLKLNGLGHLRSFFYKPPFVFMDMETADGRKQTLRVNPVTVEREFLLSPLINTSPEFWRIREGLPGSKIIRITLRFSEGGRKYFKRNLALSTTPIRLLEP